LRKREIEKMRAKTESLDAAHARAQAMANMHRELVGRKRGEKEGKTIPPPAQTVRMMPSVPGHEQKRSAVVNRAGTKLTPFQRRMIGPPKVDAGEKTAAADCTVGREEQTKSLPFSRDTSASHDPTTKMMADDDNHRSRRPGRQKKGAPGQNGGEVEDAYSSFEDMKHLDTGDGGEGGCQKCALPNSMQTCLVS
jgi:hypothetical protein